MKEFLSTRTIGDWILYGIVTLIAIGTILFVFGFFFSFSYSQLNSFLGTDIQTNISKLCSKNDTNLFMLNEVAGPLPSVAFGYWVTAIIGCSILMLVVLIFIGILVWWLILELFNKFNKLKEA